jgi:hypothetical protein
MVERMRPKIGGLVLALLIAGCGGRGAAHDASSVPARIARARGAIVPWVDRAWAPGPKTTTTAAPDAPDCTSGALAVFDVDGGGAAGENYFVATLENTAPSWCTLHSVTAASGLDRKGRRIALHLATGAAQAFRVAPSGFVNVALVAPDICGPNRDQLPTLRYDTVWLSMRAVNIAVPRLHLIVCDNEFSTDLDAYDPPPQPPKPGTAAALTATIEPGYRITHGVIDYVVDVRNPSSVAFPLYDCAKYTGFFAAADAYVARTYELNCDTIHRIAPHAVVRYAMRLTVPPNARSGKLDWQLGDHDVATAVQF